MALTHPRHPEALATPDLIRGSLEGPAPDLIRGRRPGTAPYLIEIRGLSSRVPLNADCSWSCRTTSAASSSYCRTRPVGAPLVGARKGGAEKGDHEGRPYRSARSDGSTPRNCCGAATGTATFAYSQCQTAIRKPDDERID